MAIENDINNSIQMKLMKSLSVKAFYYVLVAFPYDVQYMYVDKRSVYRFSTYLSHIIMFHVHCTSTFHNIIQRFQINSHYGCYKQWLRL